MPGAIVPASIPPDVHVPDVHASASTAASRPPSWGGPDGPAFGAFELPHPASTKTPARSADPYAGAPFADLVVIVMAPLEGTSRRIRSYHRLALFAPSS